MIHAAQFQPAKPIFGKSSFHSRSKSQKRNRKFFLPQTKIRNVVLLPPHACRNVGAGTGLRRKGNLKKGFQTVGAVLVHKFRLLQRAGNPSGYSHCSPIGQGIERPYFRAQLSLHQPLAGKIVHLPRKSGRPGRHFPPRGRKPGRFFLGGIITGTINLGKARNRQTQPHA